MSIYIPNTNANLNIIRRAEDGGFYLSPILYWWELRYSRVPIDLTRMSVGSSQICDADFAIHDASDGRVYLRDGNVFDTLEAFEEATGD